MLQLRHPRANALVFLRADCVSAIQASDESWSWQKPGGRTDEWEHYQGPSCAIWLTNAANPIYVRGTVEELRAIIEEALSKGE